MAIIKQSGGAVRASAMDLADIGARADLILEQAREHAAQIISEARSERTRLLESARSEGLKQGRREGMKRGIEAGRREGREQALREAREVLERLGANLSEACETIERERTDLIEDARRDLMALALAIAEKVLRQAIACDPSLVGDLVAGLVEECAGAHRLTLVIHPDDEAPVRMALTRGARAGGPAGGVEILHDRTLERGACLVRREGETIVDARLQTQIERIARELLGDDEARGGVAA